MATRTNKVEVEIVAIDEASPKIDKLEKKIDGLESDEARIIVTANIERLDKQLTDALAKMHNLDGDELTVQARLVGTLEDDLRHANDLLEQLDGKTGTVRIDADTTQARQNLDELGRSADSSKSVLANMVGNATQDLGALGGVAGSAGVAIGQMGEYMTDALGEGQKLGTVLADFGKVAGPIALVSLGVQLLTSHMQKVKEREKELQEQTEEVTDALLDAQDAGEGLVNTLTGLGDVEIRNILKDLSPEDLDALGLSMKALGIDYTDLVNEFASEQPGDVRGLQAIGNEMTALFNKIEAGSTTNRSNASIWEEVGKQYGLTGEQARQLNFDIATLNDAVGEELDLQEQAIAQGKIVTDLRKDYVADTEAMTAATLEWAKANKPIEDMPKTWQTAVQAARDLLAGEKLTAAETQAIVVLMQQYGMTNTEVLDTALGLWEDQQDAIDGTAEATDAAAASTAAFGDEINQIVSDAVDYGRKIRDTKNALKELADEQDQIEADALSGVFDVGDEALDTLTDLQKINDEIRDFAEWRQKLGRVPNIFDPTDVDADDLLAKIQGLRDPIQEQIARVFSESGAAAAQAMANSLVNTIAMQSGLTEDQVRGLLNIPEDLTINLKVAVDKTDEAVARRLMEIFSMLGPGQALRSLQIETMLNDKKLTPRQARLALEDELAGAGFPVPLTLQVPTSAEVERVRRETEALMGGIAVPITPDFSKFPAQFQNGVALAIPPGSFNFNQTINNPPGTPAATVGSTITYGRRNGERPET